MYICSYVYREDFKKHKYRLEKPDKDGINALNVNFHLYFAYVHMFTYSFVYRDEFKKHKNRLKKPNKDRIHAPNSKRAHLLGSQVAATNCSTAT